ncbi:MAG: hypothetical protein K8T25_00330 [Planctomycetia bacterium]|nr:hypothetical protein [Planctomycetia bacterium]
MDLPQLSYDVAYFILPHYAYNDFSKVVDLCMETPNAAGPFFYLMACQFRDLEPVIEDAPKFRWSHGPLEDDWDYFVLQYPVPPPIDMSDVALDEMLNASSPPVLAPHFSGIICHRESGEVKYFVLGQAPLGGGTTFRSVLANGNNCNLGPGPEPNTDAFLDVMRDRVRGE